MVHQCETCPSTRRVNTPSIRKEPGKRLEATGNWDKLIDDKYLMLTDANVVEAYEVGADRKASKIGTAESIVEARLLFCQGAKNWKMSYDGIPVDGNKGNALPQGA
jgi:hypothetical protein